MVDVARLVGTWVFILTSFAFSWIGSIIYLAPTLVTLPFSPRLFRAVNDWFVAQFFTYVTFVLEHAVGIRFVITGDDVPPGECGIMMSNHRTRTDFIFLWALFYYKLDLSHMKIALKYPLKHIPGFGWACQMFSFLFLKRNWEEDKENIASLLGCWRDNAYPLQLLYFPEGTDLTQSTQARSHSFADKNGLPRYYYTLHPRVNGFIHCLKQLRGSVKAVYDVTIGYPTTIPQNEMDILSGRLPEQVHMHLRRIPICDIPEDDVELAHWVEKIWRDKEETLRRFYEETPSLLPPNSPPRPPAQYPPGHYLRVLMSLCFWSVWILTAFVPLFYSTFMLTWLVLGNIAFIALSKYAEIYKWEAMWTNKRARAKRE